MTEKGTKGKYKMKKTALIMAGGRGERFWPRSRKDLPKQFLSLTGDGKTMLQLTVERLLPIVDIEDIYIATTKDYKELAKEQLPKLPSTNIICEPVGRNTAPCIGLGAAYIAKRYEDAIMYVLPADHLIKFNKMFLATLEDAAKLAKEDGVLVTIGISPDYPETGYGYIKFDTNKKRGNGYKVDRFVEKPSIELAMEYIDSGEYLWNSGMFTWRVSSILDNIRQLMPDTYTSLMRISKAIGKPQEEEALTKEYELIKPQSIDYGVMENASDIYVIPGIFGWDDVGSWLAVERLQKSNKEGNVIAGDVIAVNTKSCILQGQDKLIATVGIEDMIVVDTKDALLICHKDHAGEIKELIEKLKDFNHGEYL